jgi:hypothetical protein
VRVGTAPFADLVFHVLAHVPADAAASAWDPTYMSWAEARLGPASARALGEDARALAALLGTHEALVRAQLVAWLFADDGRRSGAAANVRAASHFERALAELGGGDVDAPDVLGHVAGDPGAELLWCAIALEAEHHARLPPVSIDPALAPALVEASAAAPSQPRFEIAVVRSLRQRGRVRGRAVWVGAPSEDFGPSARHAAWQGAHEATVAEVSEREPSLAFGDLEHVAIALLAERARRAKLEAQHGMWLASLRAPDPRADTLSARARAAFERF